MIVTGGIDIVGCQRDCFAHASTIQLPHDNNFCEKVAELFVPLDPYLEMELGQDFAEEAYKQQQ